MKKFLAMVLLLSLFAVPSHAFFFNGTIDDEFSYSNFKLSGKYVSVTIENNTEKRIEFYARLFFLSLFDDVLAVAYFNTGYITPSSSIKYRTVVHHNSGKGAKDAMEIEWQRIK